ncbi:AMP binding protein [Multifurca ochricompacta]|uniref:AMP binding protein n=1 Tax=Multifurca ochricompacta TaxID=376703 RepID=A0AAD4QNV4_9AGAM|nr:AMP binding protein [Multifurca ochricompacta]
MSPSSIFTPSFPNLELVSESLWTFLFQTIQHDQSLPAFIESETGRVLSRAELRSLSLEFAYGIRTRLPQGSRLFRGDTAMIFSPNSFAWPIALFGLLAGGVRSTLANSAYTPAELAFQYNDSRACVVFSHPDLIPIVFSMFKHIDGVDRFEGSPGHGALPEEEKFVGSQANETQLLCYSSGTTGKPKGVETTHRNLTSVLPMVEAVQMPLLPRRDVALGVLPYYHIYGVVKLMLYPMLCGFPVVILPKFDPEQFCRSIERYKVTAAFVVPPIILALVHHPATNKYDLRSLKLLLSGAAPLSAGVVDLAVKRFKSVGATVHVTQGYGLTETSPVTHLLPPKDSHRKVGSIGTLLPNLEARLVASDEDNIIDAAPGEPGELWIRGPTVMKGYLNNPSATADSINADGWFKTGDIAVRDEEGYYQIVDRKKELIKYKGFQVPPAELESVLLQHPEIVDAAVIGIDNPAQATELPRAYVVHKAGASNAPKSFPKDVQLWIKARVAKHKFLRGGVVVVDSIPKRLIYFLMKLIFDVGNIIFQRCGKNPASGAT